MNPVSIIQYIECENFKVFGSLEQISFSQPSVLIGPNNSGKTTVLQALTIWNQGIRNWFQEKKHIKNVKNSGVGLNRLLITQVPVKEAKYFWNNTKTKSGKDNIEIKITVGLWYNNEVQPCTLILKYYNSEVVYMYPSEDTFAHEGLVEFAAGIDVKILYPMSGITNQEFLLQKGAIDTYIGQGKTSEVLVNLCYKIYENNEADWRKITELMYKLFEVQLQKPLFLEANGTVELKYNTKGITGKSNGLDISLSGRGQQEMLLLIAYLFSHKKSVLLLDEPDAHLEILRQRQVFALLKHLASENGNQIIIATHSEVIANEAGNNNLTLLIGGDIIDLTHNPSGQIRAFIEQYGMEHYYKAKLKKRIIYVEGSTDIDMLSAFAKKLKHPCQAIFEDTFYYFYTQDVEEMPDFDKELARIAANNFIPKQIYRQHFSIMKNAIPDFRGIALFDGDAKNRIDEREQQKDFALVYWKKYELENYFANPNTVFAFIENTCKNERILSKYKEIWDKQVLISVFDNRQQPYLAYNKGDAAYQSFQFEELMNNKKASLFLEDFFTALSTETNTPLLLRKGEFYQLIPYLDLDNMSSEVKEKLDLIEQYLN